MKRQRHDITTTTRPFDWLSSLMPDLLIHVALTAEHPDGAVTSRQDLVRLTRLRSVSRRLLDFVDRLVLPRVTRLSSSSFNEIGYTNATRFTGLRTLHVLSTTPSYVPRLLVTRLSRLSALHIGRLRKRSYLDDMRVGTLTQLTELTTGNRLGNNELAPLTNLTVLALRENDQVTDETLVRLTNLTALNLRDNSNITDAGLSTLTRLTSLELTDQAWITDAALSIMTQLRSLALGANDNITDASLSRLASLTFLAIVENEHISDSGLACLTNLTFLKAGWAERVGDRGLSRLTALTNLSIGSYYEQEILADGITITDTAIASLTNLRRLTLHPGSNTISNRGLSRLTSLTWLKLQYNVLITDEALASLTALTWLDIVGTKQIHTLEKLTALRELDITNSAVHSETVSHLTALERLTVRSHSFEAIGRMHLENMTALVALAMQTPEFLSPQLYQEIIDRGGAVTR